VKENDADALVIAGIFELVTSTWPGVVLAVDPVGKFTDLAELVSA
jgi:hypothetical protein